MKYYLYTHIGSGNRGCEATARSLYKMLGSNRDKFCVFSENKIEEKKCETEKYATVYYTPSISGMKPLTSVLPRVLSKFKIDELASTKYRYKDLFNVVEQGGVGLSTGGDVFCYNQSLANKIGYLTKNMKKKGNKIFLMACSIAEENITPKTLEILKEYDCIFPRESLTAENLKKKGLSNIKIYPDPAFVLDCEPVCKELFSSNVDYVGINFSCYTNHGYNIGEKYLTIVKFMKYILENTNMNIILIPHVFWDAENDIELLRLLQKEFSQENRVVLIDKEYKSTQLKYIISKCRFFVGSRTHSVIGAYSSNVPTLAVGYSIKSRGIAKDIFGDYKNYVFDSNNLDDYDMFLEKFLYIVEHEKEICRILKEKNIVFKQQLEEQSMFMKSVVENEK